MPIGILYLAIQLPGCQSLKEKRSRLKPLLARLHREFNVSAAELDQLDAWQSAILGCASLSNDMRHNQRVLQQIVDWVENNWSDVLIVEQRIESLS